MAKIKVTLSLDQSIVDRVKAFAVEKGIPFSGAVSLLCTLGMESWHFNPNARVNFKEVFDILMELPGSDDRH